MRYTPAGLPALDLTLRHDAERLQLGQPRKLAFDMRAKAVGPVTAPLLASDLGVEHDFEGFVGAQRNGRGIVFHIESMQPNHERNPHHAPAPR